MERREGYFLETSGRTEEWTVRNNLAENCRGHEVNSCDA